MGGLWKAWWINGLTIDDWQIARLSEGRFVSPNLRSTIRQSHNVHGMYVELHTSSAFSFLEAASLPETLIDQAARYGYPAIALVDRDGVYGVPRFHRAALAAGIRPIIGAELTLSPPSRLGASAQAPSHPTHPSHPAHPS